MLRLFVKLLACNRYNLPSFCGGLTKETDAGVLSLASVLFLTSVGGNIGYIAPLSIEAALLCARLFMTFPFVAGVGKYRTFHIFVAVVRNARRGWVFEFFELCNGIAHVGEKHIGHVTTETLS